MNPCFCFKTYQQAAIALIDAGTCPTREANSVCATSATNDGGAISYYSEFEYDGNLIVVSSGIPDHVAENNTGKNPNWRCKVP